MKATLEASGPRINTMEDRQGGDSNQNSDKYKGQITNSQYWDKLLKKKTNKLVRNAVRPNVNNECH